jgi:hypothetical protein
MRITPAVALILAGSAANAFEPGSFGEPLEEQGYVVGCTGLAAGGSCEIHARGAVFVAWGDGPSEPDALQALASLKQGAPVTFTADELSMGDVTVEMALNTVKPYSDDPLATLVQNLQGTWVKDGRQITITGLEWAEGDGASYLISMGTSCADGVERTGLHFSLYQMGGDPFDSICLEVQDEDVARIGLRDVVTGEEVVLTR